MTHTKNSSNCIGIVGLGLIGGSLALDLQALGFKVHGLVHRATTATKAKERGLAQVISTDPKILSDCDLIILALPLDQLLKPSQSLLKALPPSAVITDVGSVKAPVLKTWTKLHQRFVASHPMAGNANSGVGAGQIELFKHRPWVATPDTNTDTEALKKVQDLALALSSEWITAEAEMHDQAVALISHLPVLISAALLKTLCNERNPSLLELAKKLASTGFADTTRVGGGNPTLGTGMMENNSSAILRALSSYRWSLEQFEEAMISQHWSQIQAELEKTQTLRPEFLNDKL
ncbi:prephenate/arogenate dehydrogenase [Prochlorococcus sp. MIT 1307]|uniref:prephenate/arogenate dehydrogenase n=1 Tax=Prochlorococcus sp. MIT 1307 TaxID=3096219 RepID=UPI002A754B25|nr:prephenate/arogenate dehydrogenase [Prochlorococcus sp. MIT 1307]